jgi:hypothetical protein
MESKRSTALAAGAAGDDSALRAKWTSLLQTHWDTCLEPMIRIAREEYKADERLMKETSIQSTVRFLIRHHIDFALPVEAWREPLQDIIDSKKPVDAERSEEILKEWDSYCDAIWLSHRNAYMYRDYFYSDPLGREMRQLHIWDVSTCKRWTSVPMPLLNAMDRFRLRHFAPHTSTEEDEDAVRAFALQSQAGNLKRKVAAEEAKQQSSQSSQNKRQRVERLDFLFSTGTSQAAHLADCTRRTWRGELAVDVWLSLDNALDVDISTVMTELGISVDAVAVGATASAAPMATDDPLIAKTTAALEAYIRSRKTFHTSQVRSALLNYLHFFPQGSPLTIDDVRQLDDDKVATDAYDHLETAKRLRLQHWEDLTRGWKGLPPSGDVMLQQRIWSEHVRSEYWAVQTYLTTFSKSQEHNQAREQTSRLAQYFKQLVDDGKKQQREMKCQVPDDSSSGEQAFRAQSLDVDDIAPTCRDAIAMCDQMLEQYELIVSCQQREPDKWSLPVCVQNARQALVDTSFATLQDWIVFLQRANFLMTFLAVLAA